MDREQLIDGLIAIANTMAYANHLMDSEEGISALTGAEKTARNMIEYLDTEADNV